MQAKLGAAIQEVNVTKQALAMSKDNSDRTSEQMESAMMEPHANKEAFIRIQANRAPISTFQTNSSYLIFNVKMTRLMTSDGARTLDAVSSIQSTLHCNFILCALGLNLTEKF